MYLVSSQIRSHTEAMGGVQRLYCLVVHSPPADGHLCSSFSGLPPLLATGPRQWPQVKPLPQICWPIPPHSGGNGLNTECHVHISGVPNMQSNSGYEEWDCQCTVDSLVELPPPQIWVSPCSQEGRSSPVLGKIGIIGEKCKSMVVTKPILRFGRSGVFR